MNPPLCPKCLHRMRDGQCWNAECAASVVATGYTVPPKTFTQVPDPFPAEVCPTCLQVVRPDTRHSS